MKGKKGLKSSARWFEWKPWTEFWETSDCVIPAKTIPCSGQDDGIYALSQKMMTVRKHLCAVGLGLGLA